MDTKTLMVPIPTTLLSLPQHNPVASCKIAYDKLIRKEKSIGLVCRRVCTGCSHPTARGWPYIIAALRDSLKDNGEEKLSQLLKLQEVCLTVSFNRRDGKKGDLY